MKAKRYDEPLVTVQICIAASSGITLKALAKHRGISPGVLVEQLLALATAEPVGAPSSLGRTRPVRAPETPKVDSGHVCSQWRTNILQQLVCADYDCQKAKHPPLKRPFVAAKSAR